MKIQGTEILRRYKNVVFPRYLIEAQQNYIEMCPPIHRFLTTFTFFQFSFVFKDAFSPILSRYLLFYFLTFTTSFTMFNTPFTRWSGFLLKIFVDFVSGIIRISNP